MSVSGIKSRYKSAAAAWVGVVGLFLLALWTPASAVTVSGLYSVQVPVGAATGSELTEGYANGLARVFVRVSGSRDVLGREGVSALLADAESLLLSYQVTRNAEGGNLLEMTFGAVGVNRALASVGAPLWGANRPLTLAWVAVEDRGARTLITQGGAGQGESPVPDSWRTLINQAAEERGLPVALPAGEFAGDRELLSDIWGQFISRIRGVSDQVDQDVLSVVRISRSGGQWRAGWVFDGMAMSGGEDSVTAPSPEALVQALINRWADVYANRYAVAAGDVSESPQVDIVLRGVSSLADYGQINQGLEKLAPVVSVGASRLKDDRLSLRVAFSSELDQLQEYIALDSRFVPIEADDWVTDGASKSQAEQRAAAGPDLKTQSEPQSTAANEPVTAPGAQASPVGSTAAAGASSAATSTYQPLEVDESEAEEAFESLYQVLYYQWQPAPVIGKDGGQ